MWRKPKKDKEEERFKKFDNIKNEFRTQVDKNTSVSVYDTSIKTIFVIKKNLHDYKIFVSSSEAPVQNSIKEFEIQPYEEIIGERAILEKEVFPLNEKLQNNLGERSNLRIKGIRLCIGREDDYITIDERDLANNDINPSIQGLKEFIFSNQRSVLGFSIREFNPKKGNMVFLKCGCDEPISDIKSIKVQILASLQQRGFFMQKYNKPYGIQMFIVLIVRKTNEMISGKVINLLRDLGVPLEMIFLRRSSSIQNWSAIECEINNMNLRNYLQSKYDFLSHSDVIQIANFCNKYKLDFDVANMMGEMLNKMKIIRLKGDKKEQILEREEIAAAGKLAAVYFGIDNIKLSKDLNEESIKKIENELNEYY
ncbi:MAG: hypothetical protein ACTSO9_12800 [Candidatus Helarchaeota archaeon]